MDKLDANVSSESDRLPLDGFFAVLRKNNFSLSAGQITDAYQIISHYALLVTDEKELVNYLSPVFCRDQDEQQRFETLFKNYFGSGPKIVGPLPNKEDVIQQAFWKQWRWLVAMAVFIIAGIVVLYIFYKPPVPHVTYDVQDPDEVLRTNAGMTAFQAAKGDSLHVSVFPETASPIHFDKSYDWGDKSKSDSARQHQYHQPGRYMLRTKIITWNVNRSAHRDTVILRVVKISGGRHNLEIRHSNASNILRTRENITLKAVITGKRPDTIKWRIGNRTVKFGDQLDTAFSAEGTPVIYAEAVYSGVDSLGNLKKSINLIVDDRRKSKTTIFPAPGAKPIRADRQINTIFLWIVLALIALSLLLLLLTIYFLRRRNKRLQQVSIEYKYDLLISGFAGQKPPVELPFKNKNHLTVTEPLLNEAAWQMRRKVDGNANYLDIKLTVGKAIRNFGLFQPVNITRTRQKEFLVLIDRSAEVTIQAELFDCLVGHLTRQNVFIDRFYFKDSIEQCFNEQYTESISLYKLYDKYAQHTLLIFGRANQLVYNDYPVFKREYRYLLELWVHKVILTPVSFTDWGTRELDALAPNVPVLPVDIPGQLLLTQKLFTEDADINWLLKQGHSFYSSARYDFGDIKQLEKYCAQCDWANHGESNILVQWIAALALYPKISWPITLAIGKTILEKYGQAHQLNFTTLLRISRINWMARGRFPEHVRLQLLSRLETENEIIARETIISVLNEIIEAEVGRDSFAFEEKQLQLITNEFNLFAYDNNKYRIYKDSQALFQKLWYNGKISDAPVKVYLVNKHREWETLIGKATGNDGQSTPLRQYLDNIEQGKPIRKYKWLPYISAVPLILSLILLVLLVVFPGSARFDRFRTDIPHTYPIKFNLADSSGVTNLHTISLRIDDSSAELSRYQPHQSFDLSFNPAEGKDMRVSMDGKLLLDTTLKLQYDSYNLEYSQVKLLLDYSLSARQLSPGNTMKVTIKVTGADGNKIRNAVLILAGPKEMAFITTGTNSLQANTDSNGVCVTNIRALASVILPKNYNLAISARYRNAAVSDVVQIPSGVSLPPIYIHYSAQVSLANVKTLESCLASLGVFKIMPPILDNPSATKGLSGNEIRYFSAGFADSIKFLQTCLQGSLPASIFSNVRLNQARLANGAAAEIWIIFEAPIPTPTPYAAIQFEYDSSVLKTSNYPALDAMSADLRSNSNIIEIDGYTSSEGTAAHNLRISKDQANSVKTYLVNSGVDAKRLKVKGYGETHPVADNSTEAGRILNRRVEFKVIQSSSSQVISSMRTQLLQPLMGYLDTSKILYDVYAKAKTYRNARAIYAIDSRMLSLLNSRGYLLTAPLQASGAQLRTHLQAWTTAYEKLAKTSKVPNDNYPFQVIYTGPVFPTDAAAILRAAYQDGAAKL